LAVVKAEVLVAAKAEVLVAAKAEVLVAVVDDVVEKRVSLMGRFQERVARL